MSRSERDVDDELGDLLDDLVDHSPSDTRGGLASPGRRDLAATGTVQRDSGMGQRSIGVRGACLSEIDSAGPIRSSSSATDTLGLQSIFVMTDHVSRPWISRPRSARCQRS